MTVLHQSTQKQVLYPKGSYILCSSNLDPNACPLLQQHLIVQLVNSTLSVILGYIAEVLLKLSYDLAYYKCIIKHSLLAQLLPLKMPRCLKKRRRHTCKRQKPIPTTKRILSMLTSYSGLGLSHNINDHECFLQQSWKSQTQGIVNVGGNPSAQGDYFHRVV